MMNLLDLDSLGSSREGVVQAIKYLLPTLLNTKKLLELQKQGKFFSKTLDKRTDRVTAKMAMQVKGQMDGVTELIGYMQSALEEAVTSNKRKGR